jgi:hypothetical protein
MFGTHISFPGRYSRAFCDTPFRPCFVFAFGPLLASRLSRTRHFAPIALADNRAPMDHTFLSAFILLLLVLDPFGSLPVFISILGAVKPERRTFVAVREVLIAFAVLVLFMVSGQGFLRWRWPAA